MWLQWLWYSMAVFTSLAGLCLAHVFINGTDTSRGAYFAAASLCSFILAEVNLLVILGAIGWSLYWEGVWLLG